MIVSSQPFVCRSRKNPSREGSLRDRHTDGCEETSPVVVEENLGEDFFAKHAKERIISVVVIGLAIY